MVFQFMMNTIEARNINRLKGERLLNMMVLIKKSKPTDLMMIKIPFDNSIKLQVNEMNIIKLTRECLLDVSGSKKKDR